MSNRLEQSVKDQLKNIARETGKDFNFVCIQYLQERFLARLEKSVYRDNFILKGALLLLAYKIPVVRPSKDIDFLGQRTSNETDQIESAIREIAEIDLEDGVVFQPEEMAIEQITDDAEYGGFRVRISATAGGDWHRLQLDIGFGDKIIDGPLDIDYPAMLDFPPPRIKVYSLESAIAEKLEAIVSLGTFSSRMKDYFDVWFLIRNQNTDNGTLRKAIYATFERRNTPIEDFQFIFSDAFKTNADKKRQWKAFLNRSYIDSEHSFEEVVSEIESFINPII
jgi:predicted nucleotidyltransferase component of viral defense system